MRSLKIEIITLFLFFSSSAIADTYEDTNKKSQLVISDLQTMNEAGMRCDLQLSAHGLQGLNTDECDQYHTGLQSILEKNVGPSCLMLLEWFRNQQEYMKANPTLPDKNPELATKILISMKAVKKACEVEKYEANYPYLMKPASHIQSLKKLQN